MPKCGPYVPCPASQKLIFKCLWSFILVRKYFVCFGQPSQNIINTESKYSKSFYKRENKIGKSWLRWQHNYVTCQHIFCRSDPENSVPQIVYVLYCFVWKWQSSKLKYILPIPNTTKRTKFYLKVNNFHHRRQK